MLALDNPRWATFQCALGCRCDQRALVRAFADGTVTSDDWQDAYNFVVYQDGIGELSLAAAPYLLEYIQNSEKIRWEPLSLLASIKLAIPKFRTLPQDLVSEFQTEFARIPSVLAGHRDRTWDELVTRCAVSCIALACGHRGLAEFYLEFSYDELSRWNTFREAK